MTRTLTEGNAMGFLGRARRVRSGTCSFTVALALSLMHAASIAEPAAPREGPGTAPPASATTPQDTRYRLQYSDVINLSFPLSPEFNQTVTVQSDGYIETIGGKDVHALGMTIPELVQAVKDAYATTLHDPIISVTL